MSAPPAPEVAAEAEAAGEGHGHGAVDCPYCDEANHCDCPCETCVLERHIAAGSACACCGRRGPTDNGCCPDCAQESDYGHPDTEPEEEEAEEAYDDDAYIPRCANCNCDLEGCDSGWGPYCGRRCALATYYEE